VPPIGSGGQVAGQFELKGEYPRRAVQKALSGLGRTRVKLARCCCTTELANARRTDEPFSDLRNPDSARTFLAISGKAAYDRQRTIVRSSKPNVQPNVELAQDRLNDVPGQDQRFP